MSLKLAKKLISFAALLAITNLAHAAAATIPPTETIAVTPVQPSSTAGTPTSPTTANPPTIDVPTNSNAVAFAKEAGRVAGIVQGCGQDVSVFLNRVNEAVNKLSVGMPDKVLAMETFQSSMRQAQLAETTKNVIPCPQAIKDFNSMPILKDDYQKTVISQLNPSMSNNPNPDKNNSAVANVQNNATNTAPPSQVQQNAGYAQPQQYVPNKNAPQPTQPSYIQQNAGYPSTVPNNSNTSATSYPPSG